MPNPGGSKTRPGQTRIRASLKHQLPKSPLLIRKRIVRLHRLSKKGRALAGALYTLIRQFERKNGAGTAIKLRNRLAERLRGNSVIEDEIVQLSLAVLRKDW
ncbi:MAG: hypothetical protein Q7R47_02345 [Candidatus Diapherotrites archaeon]|nr:hypothetical protein [Candidatus Diapherotrites archaeon]